MPCILLNIKCSGETQGNKAPFILLVGQTKQVVGENWWGAPGQVENGEQLGVQFTIFCISF